MRDIVARPLEQVRRTIGVTDPGNIGADIGADYLTSPIAKLLDRTAAIIEVSSFVIGWATGSAPLMISSAKLLAHREINHEIQREIIQEVRSLWESRNSPRDQGEEQDRNRTERDSRKLRASGNDRNERQSRGDHGAWRSGSSRAGRPGWDLSLIHI